jgi:hypothetical protein
MIKRKDVDYTFRGIYTLGDCLDVQPFQQLLILSYDNRLLNNHDKYEVLKCCTSIIIEDRLTRKEREQR